MKVTAIICAAGRGERAGFDKNKLLVPLYGAPMLWHTLKKFAFADEILITCSERDKEEISAIAKPFGAKLTEGGATRTLSVYNALKKASGDIVLIHDGARPFVSEKIIKGCIESVEKYSSGICAVPSTDTIAVCGVSDGNITSVPPRDRQYLVQTPQGFKREEILAAYEKAIAGGGNFTDDSSVYLNYFGCPHICEGDPANKKLTYASDFNSGERGILWGQFKNVGFGVDVHAFGKGGEVTLCGVKIPCDSALIAHSDGDVAVHAVMDALLSAAGLDDIGHYFPDSDPAYLNADSIKMLERVVKILTDRGYSGVNLSLSIQAEKPRLFKHIPQMKSNLSAATGIPEESIAIAAGTCEGLGFVGEGKGIAAYCAATIKRT